MNSRVARSAYRRASILVRGAFLLSLSACAASVASNPSRADPATTLDASSSSMHTASSADLRDDDSVALERLWKARLRDSEESPSAGSFVLGPGDLLVISVPPIEQLRNRRVRVSEDDTIALPLLGEISVTGMTEKDLRAALTSRLAKYMYHPQIDVFIEQAEDRQVAVLGAVKAPGRYMLTSRSDTVMTAVSRAGGITEGAASRIILVPAPVRGARSRDASQAVQVASAGDSLIMPIPTGSDSGDGDSRFASGGSSPSHVLDSVRGAVGGDELVINMTQPKSQRYMEIPVRPGDVVLVPVAGEVSVQGWVDKAGSFKVTPGMTVLSAIAAAGGALFTSSATLLRDQPDGGKQSVALDLPKMKSGEQADLPVEGGDVIMVERSVLGAVPYSVYFLTQHIGLGLPVY